MKRIIRWIDWALLPFGLCVLFSSDLVRQTFQAYLEE